MNFIGYKEWLNELSGEVFNPVRGEPMEFDPKEHPELTPEIFDLINIAYSEIGGHSKVEKPEDILKNTEWDYWSGTDIHGTKDFDIIIFGQKTRYGIKFSGVGHDGEKDSKREYLSQRADDLHHLGFYLECSGKLAEIMINKYGCPTVDDEAEARKLIPKLQDWLGTVPNQSGTGWYTRLINKHLHTKIVLGRPNI